jgi:hypothetical protein
MKKDFLIADESIGRLNALVKRIGGLEVMNGILNGKLEFTITNQPFKPIQLFWKNLYKKYFNLDINPSIIEDRPWKWALFIAKGLTIQQVYEALPFNKWKNVDEDLEKVVTTNDRTSDKEDYVVYVNQNIESDEQFKNKSADDLKKTNHTGITLMERLLLELYYFEETREHLDLSSITLCSGSRYSGGVVPRVYWCVDWLKVDWSRASDSDDNLRSRSVVS